MNKRKHQEEIQELRAVHFRSLHQYFNQVMVCDCGACSVLLPLDLEWVDVVWMANGFRRLGHKVRSSRPCAITGYKLPFIEVFRIKSKV